jgi:Domain of unknown function (DUF4340)
VWGPFVRRHFASLAIVALAAMLGGYLYFVDSGRVSSGEADLRKRNLFKAFRRAEITELTIEDTGDVIRITKRTDDAGDTLYYLDGGEFADQSAVDKTLSVLEFATAERHVDGAVDRHAMGLDAPKTRVTLSMGALTFRLAIGAPAPAPAGAAYAEVLGEGLVVVARDVVTELTRPRDVYRSKTLVPYLSSSLSELRLDGAGGPRRLVIGGWGGWALVLDDRRIVRADREAIDRLLTSLADVRAEAFTTEADAAHALAATTDKLRMTMIPRDASHPRAVLDIGGRCPGHPEDVTAVRTEPAPRKPACVPKGVMDSLSIPVGRLLDLHLFSFRPDEMEEIALASDQQKLDLVRAGTGWHLRAPTEGNVDNEVGQGFARTLHDLTAEEIVAGKAAESVGLGTPRATAKITKAGAGDDAPSEVIELGSDVADGFVYARRQMDGAILRLTRDAARTLVPSGFALRSRKVIDEPAGHVGRISIEGTSVRQVLRRSGSGVWTLEEPKSLAIDPGLAADVAEALAQLRADRWVADRDDGSFGLAEPRAKYELELEGGVIRVETGRATSGGVFARRTDREGVFVLPKAAERTLETWAVDRSYFMVDPNDVRQIRIDRGADHLRLEPAGPGAPDAGAAAERFEIARRSIAEARAEGLVHPGAPHKEEGFARPLMTLTIVRASSTIVISIGRGDAFRDTNVFYARRDGIDATFAIAQSKLRPLFDLN